MYGTLSKSAMAPLNESVASMDASSIVSPATSEKPDIIKEEDLNDPEGTVIASGSTCKRRGCGHVFNASTSPSSSCVFHSGAPVFHEGSKGWSCCPRKVLEFDEFLKIKGCKEGKHRFTDVVKVCDLAFFLQYSYANYTY